MFRCPEIARLMKRHVDNKSLDSKMCIVMDNEHYNDINYRYPDFAEDPRNVQLGLVGDKVNPYGNQSNKHSTWPFLMVVNNLPL